MLLGVTQQVLLIPVFLRFWTSDVLAAWFAIYAVGNLIVIADAGLQFRAINRFLAFKSSVDCDGRTSQFYAAMLRIYLELVGALGLLLLILVQVWPPSVVLGFATVAHFDAAFVIMALGMLLMLPSNLASGLYNARGYYSRAVWIQSSAVFVAQLLQMVVIVTTGSLLAVAVAYIGVQLFVPVYLLGADAPGLFPFLRYRHRTRSWRWNIGQLRLAFPFAFAGAAEAALANAPVLLVSALVPDRIAVAQWGLTRVIAGMVRALCIQVSLPLAAELGHEYAVGHRAQLRALYARGSALVAILASFVISGLLPFWPDFFAIWTHGSIPYDASLTITLLIGTSLIAPSILALGFANYSNSGDLLLRTKGFQIVVFLVLALTLIPRIGTLGAAIAIVTSDLLAQFGLLGLIVIWQTLGRPFRHVVFLMTVTAVVIITGWLLGTIIRPWVPGSGLVRLILECAIWLTVIGAFASSLAIAGVRERLEAIIPK